MAFLQGFGPEGDYLRGRFYTQWKALRSYTDAQMGLDDADTSDQRVAWGNRNHTKPNDAEWVRFTVQHSGADRMNPGPDPIRRHDGTVQIEVFVPSGTSEGLIDDLCDDAAGIFRDHTSQQGLRFRTPYTVNVGPDDGWYKKDVLVPFTRDTVFS